MSREGTVGYFTAANLVPELVDARLHDRYRWARALGWLAWDGAKWASCVEEAVVEQARQWIWANVERAVQERKTGRSPDDKAVTSWLKVAQTVSTGRGLVIAARGVDGVLTNVDQLDAHPDLLNTPSGIVDLRTGELSPHDPELLLTKITNAAYRPDATHPDWTQALEAIPEDVRAYAQLRYGQAATGHPPPDDVLLVQPGTGENGKSTITNAIGDALGDYHLLVADRVILESSNQHTTEIADLRGTRFALIEETPEAHRLSVARLKKTVGTPTITARHVHKDAFTFKASHSLVLSTNYVPQVSETDHGTWRRLQLLRFPYRFRKPHEQLETPVDRRGDPGLRQRLTESPEAAEAVLAWLVTGAAVWYSLDRVMPEPPGRIVADTTAWRYEADLVLAFVNDQLDLDPAAHVMSTDLLSAFNEWLRERGHAAMSDKLFASRFADHDALAGRIIKRKTRRSDALDRRPVSWQVPAQSATPDVYQAWHGLRFRRATEAAQATPTPAKTGAVPTVPTQNQITPYIHA